MANTLTKLVQGKGETSFNRQVSPISHESFYLYNQQDSYFKLCRFHSHNQSKLQKMPYQQKRLQEFDFTILG